MMKRLMTASAALVVLGRVAVAADLPSKTEEVGLEHPPRIPVFSWTGFYVGMQAGYGMGRDNVGLRSPAGGASFFGYNPNGVVGGAHAGYNYALPSIGGGKTFVIGLETDIDGADYQRTSPFGGLLAGNSFSMQSDIKGSLRGRFGFGVNRALFYATGGAAFANFDTRYNSTPSFGAGAFDAFDRTRVGYTIGGGVEYAFLNYLSVRAEYRYTNYGSFNDSLSSAAPGLNATVSHRETDNRLQAGFSYKFDSIMPDPVVARY